MTAWEREWKLNADVKIMANPDLSRFRLVLHGSGDHKYYLIENEPGEMSDVWKGCVLVPRGSKPLLFAGPKLPPWDPNNAGVVVQYKNAIDKGYKDSNADTNRLEGELEFGAKKRWVMLFLLREALDGGLGGPSDLLMVVYGKKFPWTGVGAPGPFEDGTGHGNSPRTN